MNVFFETHAHLDYDEFKPDFPAMLARAEAAGITKLISIGTDLASSRRAIALAEQHPMIYAAVGWHPSNALEAPADIRAELRELARHPRVVAIGETGLDYYRLPSMSAAAGAPVSDPARTETALQPAGSETGAPQSTADADSVYKRKQAEIFQQQLEVAAETGLNCVIHQRGDCFDATLALLEPFAARVRGVFHCFAGDAAAMRRVLALGSLVSFTGIVTFKNGQNVRATLAATPLDKFMLETDCPYLAPVPYRGKRCEPAYVKEIAEVVAQVKGCTLAELSAATCATAEEFFPKLKD